MRVVYSFFPFYSITDTFKKYMHAQTHLPYKHNLRLKRYHKVLNDVTILNE